MSIVRRSNIFDPFSLDLWDPFQGFPFDTVSETSAFANTRIDWKETPEAHVFKADLPGVKKEEVEGGGGGGPRPPDQRRAQQGEGGEERQVAPRREEQRQLPPPIPAAGERQGGPGEGVHGGRGAHRDRTQRRGQEA